MKCSHITITIWLILSSNLRILVKELKIKIFLLGGGKLCCW